MSMHLRVKSSCLGKRFLRSQKGSVAIMVAAMLSMAAVAGLGGYDMASYYSGKGQLNEAIDAGMNAAISEAGVQKYDNAYSDALANGSSAEEAALLADQALRDMVFSVVMANMKGSSNIEISADNLTFRPSTAQENLDASEELGADIEHFYVLTTKDVNYKTTFLNAMGIDEFPLEASARGTNGRKSGPLRVSIVVSARGCVGTSIVAYSYIAQHLIKKLREYHDVIVSVVPEGERFRVPIGFNTYTNTAGWNWQSTEFGNPFTPNNYEDRGYLAEWGEAVMSIVDDFNNVANYTWNAWDTNEALALAKFLLVPTELSDTWIADELYYGTVYTSCGTNADEALAWSLAPLVPANETIITDALGAENVPEGAFIEPTKKSHYIVTMGMTDTFLRPTETKDVCDLILSKHDITMIDVIYGPESDWEGVHKDSGECAEDSGGAKIRHGIGTHTNIETAEKIYFEMARFAPAALF